MAEWNAAEAAQLAEEVAAGLRNVDNKDKRLSLSALVALLDNLPGELVKEANLQQVKETLKRMTRLPKKAKVQGLLEALKDLAGRRLLLAAAEEKSTPNKEKTGEEEPAAVPEGMVRVTVRRLSGNDAAGTVTL